MTNEPTNADRAQWAKHALAIFTARTFSGDYPDTMQRDDLECAISDLICDLLHYARQQEFDTGSIMQQAAGHFGFEILEQALKLEGDDPIPLTVAGIRLMAVAPKLLKAAKATLTALELILEVDDPAAYTQVEWEAEPLATLRAVIAEAEETGRPA